MTRKLPLLIGLSFLATTCFSQMPSVSLPTVDLGIEKKFDNWRMGTDTFFVVPIKLDSFVSGVDSFSFNVVYDPSVMIPMLNIDSVNDPAYIMVQNYLSGILFPMVDGQDVIADTFSVPNNMQMMSVSFTNGGAFTNGFYSNCQGLLLYLPFFKQTPCDSGTYPIEFWDGYYNQSYINPLQTHAFLLGGAQTYMVEDTTMNIVQGSLTFPLLTISLAQNGNNLESTVTGGFPPYTYQWGNGDTSINTSLTQIGNYTLIVTDARGCIDTAIFYFNSIASLGAGNSNSIKIYPNPFTRSATLEFEGIANGTYCVKLYDITGNLLWEKVINTNRTTIDKGSLSSGMYFISIKTDEGTLKSRFVIQ